MTRREGGHNLWRPSAPDRRGLITRYSAKLGPEYKQPIRPSGISRVASGLSNLVAKEREYLLPGQAPSLKEGLREALDQRPAAIEDVVRPRVEPSQIQIGGRLSAAVDVQREIGGAGAVGAAMVLPPSSPAETTVSNGAGQADDDVFLYPQSVRATDPDEVLQTQPGPRLKGCQQRA